MARKKPARFCAFCGRLQQEAGLLVEGQSQGAYICEQCAKMSVEVIRKELRDN